MRIEVHSEYSDKLARDWEILLANFSRYGIQNTSVWIRSYIQYYLNGRECYFVAVRDARDELICCMCLQRTVRRFYVLSKYRRFQDLGTGVNDFFNVPCKIGHEAEAAACIVNWFKGNASSWERFRLSFIPGSNEFEKILIKHLQQTFPTVVTMDRLCYKVDTSGTWEDYFTAERNQQLRDVRGRINRIAKSGYVVTSRIIQKDIVYYLDDFLFHFTRRRTSKGEKNSYENASKIRLIRDVIRDGEITGKVQMSILEDQNGEVWAYQFDLIDRERGIWYHYAPTFNDKFRQFSPSKVLLFEMLREAFRDPAIKEFNFMRGEADYKKQYTDAYDVYMQVDVTNRFSRKIMFQNLMGSIVRGWGSK